MFTLEKYTGTASRHTCPKCGHKKIFVRYLDDLGGYLADDVGRCNRESKCGYHYPPKEYFADHPELSEKLDEPDRKRRRRQTPAAKPIPVVPVSFHSRQEFESSLGGHTQNPFVQFLTDLFGDDPEDLIPAIETYYVGLFDVSAGHRPDPLTCFWQIDVMGRIRKGKLMRYDRRTGKRRNVYDFKDEDGDHVEIPTYWVHKVLQKRNKLPATVNFKNCFFGEHLLRRDRSKTVAIVEAEKTAVISSICFPDLTWIAVGAQSHLQPDRLNVLRDRKVILYPDGDAFNLWSEKLIQMQRMGVDAKISRSIEDYATPEQKTDGWDLADYLIEQQREINRFNAYAAEYNRSLDLNLPKPAAFHSHVICPPSVTAAVVQSVM